MSLVTLVDNWYREHTNIPSVRIINVYSSVPAEEQNKEFNEWDKRRVQLINYILSNYEQLPSEIELKNILDTMF